MSWMLAVVLLFAPVVAEVCHPKHFHDVRGYEEDDYIIYGLTQDCQIFFIRPSQLSLLSTMKFNIHSSYCYPNLAQLHLKSHDTLLVLFKQAGNRICSLEFQIPPLEMLSGDHLFSYSILASLHYASCSHSSDKDFALETDLSFLDSVYKDVIYFIDGHATGVVWDTLQFRITDKGYLELLEKIPINNYAKHNWNGPDMSNEYVLGLDAQKNYLFQRNRFEYNYVYTCAFDLMFRPHKVAVHNGTTPSRGFRTWVNSLSADGSLLIFSETDRTINPPVTRIFGQNVSSMDKTVHCLGITNYAMELGVVRGKTLKKMKENPLPDFDGTESTTRQTTKAVMTNRIPGGSTASARRTTMQRTTMPRLRTTTLKSTTVLYNTTDVIMTTTRFEEDEEFYEEDEELPEDATPIPLSTDSTDSPPGFMRDNASLRNSSVTMASNQNLTSTVASITVFSLVIYLCIY